MLSDYPVKAHLCETQTPLFKVLSTIFRASKFYQKLTSEFTSTLLKNIKETPLFVLFKFPTISDKRVFYRKKHTLIKFHFGATETAACLLEKKAKKQTKIYIFERFFK